MKGRFINMKKYVFISNSSMPSVQEYNSRKPIITSNVHKPSLEIAKEMNYEVYLGVNRKEPEGIPNELNVHLYDSHTYRSLFDVKSNYIALRNLMTLLKKEDVDVIHCNTPVGGVIGRLGGNLARTRKIIYTAHGFHFYKGAPFFNKTVLKLAEKIMARYTDAIITMNEEDFVAAKKFRLRNNGKIYYVPGVGIDTEEFFEIKVDKKKYRKKFCLSEDDIVLISSGDLINRKNFETAIRAISSVQKSNIHLLICGEGPEKETLQKLSKELGIENQIHFLGFREDLKYLLTISDIFLFTSKQEGLPRSLMEAMAVGLPCIVSKIRGNVDLIVDGYGGYLLDPLDFEGFAKAINILASDKATCRLMKTYNLKKIKDYDTKNVKKILKKIYNEVI